MRKRTPFRHVLSPGGAAHLTVTVWLMVREFTSTFVARIWLTFLGLNLGKGCRFGGMPIIRRYPGSEIALGDGCVLVSDTRHNVVGVNHPCTFSTHNPHAMLKIGQKCGFSGTTIGCALKVEIGDRVRCGANTIITDTDWHSDDPRTSGPRPIVIEDDVWLGVNVTVLKGVRIGRGSIVGAGSVVAKSIPSGVMAAGVPARTRRKITSFQLRKLSCRS